MVHKGKLAEALNPTTLALDRQYSLYSADRSTFQQAAGANLGKVRVVDCSLCPFMKIWDLIASESSRYKARAGISSD